MVCVESDEVDNESEDNVEAGEAVESELKPFLVSASNPSSSAIEVEAIDWLGSNFDRVQELPLLKAAEVARASEAPPLLLMPISGFTEAANCSSIKLASTITIETEAVELSLLLQSLPDYPRFM